jgi:hypothetical protein
MRGKISIGRFCQETQEIFCHHRSGRPDWANFRPVGYYLVGQFFNYLCLEVAHIFWLLFSTVKFMHYFRQRWAVLRFGPFFQKNSSDHPAIVVCTQKKIRDF